MGNQVERPGGVALDYNGFNLPTRITQNGLERASFAYDGLGQRVRKTTDEGVDTYATDLYERRQRPDGSARHRMRIRAGARSVAELTLEVAPGGAVSSAKRYLHLDRLGSPALVTDEAGAVVERRSYAPFGAARDPDWASDEAPLGPVQTVILALPRPDGIAAGASLPSARTRARRKLPSVSRARAVRASLRWRAFLARSLSRTHPLGPKRTSGCVRPFVGKRWS